MTNQKMLKQQIGELQTVVHSHEMKELNFEEKDSTIRRLVEQNRSLMHDLERERSKL